jgi:site-specific DNA-methyltransferase (adenine-specific)
LSALLFNDDCLLRMPTLAPASVDLILCDLPYGTTQNKWDSVIPFDALWANYNRLNRGVTVLTAAQPFTSALVMSNPESYRYDWVWRKINATGHLNARKQPMREHESVVVFDSQRVAPYNAQGIIPYNKVTKRSRKGSSNYGTFSAENFQESTNWPKTILTFGYDGTKVHPTQKPVALMEYLIRTYTNPGDTVLDNCMGSGTTGVAAINTGRSFIGIERDPAYFAIASKRIAEAQMNWALLEAARLCA